MPRSTNLQAVVGRFNEQLKIYKEKAKQAQ
jgi:hypothetical protein